MQVLNITTSDTGGGAGKAAYRLHQGLRSLDIDSQMLVQHKASDDLTVFSESSKVGKLLAKARPTINTLPLHIYRERDNTFFSPQILPSNIHCKINNLDSDIVNLHWICDGFIAINSLKQIQKPLVWTLHDMWAFTGGCHYSGGCDQYVKSCGTCRQLQSNYAWDLSRWVWWEKCRGWKNLNLTIVTPSQWLASCARNSSLFKDKRVEIIPNGLDEKIYKPIVTTLAREILNLPQDKKLILFAAMKADSDKRKGFELLIQILEKLKSSQNKHDFELLIFGASYSDKSFYSPLKKNYCGTFYDEISMALAYSASDIFIAPSLEDNLPNTVMEALACGTPCVAFEIGGMSDMIEHKHNGYLAKSFDTDQFAYGIRWILEDSDRYQRLCDRARQKVLSEFRIEIQASRYLDLYQELIT